MAALLDNLNAFAAFWLERTAATAWQWSLLVLPIAALLTILPRARAPSLRCWVWQIVLLKLLALPVLGYALAFHGLPRPMARPLAPLRAIPVTVDSVGPIDGFPEATRRSGAGEEFVRPAAPSRAAALSPTLDWPGWLLLGWISVVLLQVVRLVRQQRALARVLANARPAEEELLAVVREAALELELARPPQARVAAGEASPFVCGIARPTLVMSQNVLASLTPRQLRHVVLHELAHVRRRDLAWGWVPEIARMLWWFHPLVHWAVFRLRLERELACDQWAMAQTGRDPADYAATLVHVACCAAHPAEVARRGDARGVNAAAKQCAQQSLSRNA